MRIMAKRRIIKEVQIQLSEVIQEDQFGLGGYWIQSEPAFGDIDGDNDSVINPAWRS